MTFYIKTYMHFTKENEFATKSSTEVALKYLFDCYNRIAAEEHQYPKV